MTDLHKLSALKVREKFLNGEISAEEIVSKTYERIEKIDSSIKSFVYLRKEKALNEAKKLDEKRKNAEKLGNLAGVVISIKDNILSKGDTSTACSKILASYEGIYNSTVVSRLKEEDAIIIGATNMDEMAMGSSTKTSCYFKTSNPWDLERTPGGSSGGAAASVSAQEVPLALGSDTGGSIRQPASFCGVVGFKPSYGRVSRYGLMSFSSSLDQIGPIAKNMEDIAIIMNIISGSDDFDATCSKKEVPNYTDYLGKDVKGLKIGVPKEYFVKGINLEVRAKLEESIEELKKLGAEIVPVSLPNSSYVLATYYVLAPAEASSNLLRYDGIRYGHRDMNAKDIDDLYKKTRSEGFGDEVKLRIMVGTYVLSQGFYDAYYKKSQKVRRLIKEDFDRAFEKVDVILTPTSPNIAFKLDEKKSVEELHLEDIFTISANLAGIPAVSIPAGIVNGMPIGIQFLANAFEEEKLFQIGSAFEKIRGEWELPKID